MATSHHQEPFRNGRVDFTTTHWSVVMAANQPHSPRAEAALTQLCRTYWYPLYAFVRRQGCDVEDAQDLTQEFFARLLARKDLSKVSPDKGRFRTFLLVTLKHFLVNEWLRQRTQKRGGGRELIPLDEVLAEHRYGLEPADELSAEKIYERRWAMTLLEQVLARLRQEFVESGKEAQFETLKIFLSAEKSPSTYAELGAQLGMSEGAVKVTVHRLRQRYQEMLREEIAHTVSSPAEIEDELRYLFSVLSA